jgi:hypothetical protein
MISSPYVIFQTIARKLKEDLHELIRKQCTRVPLSLRQPTPTLRKCGTANEKATRQLGGLFFKGE